MKTENIHTTLNALSNGNDENDSVRKGDQVYIGRGTPVGNPYPITPTCNRSTVIKKYKKWLINKLLERDEKVIHFLSSLKESDSLMCYCSPEPCHGDFIIEIWKEFFSTGCFDDHYQVFRQTYSKYGYYIPSQDGVTHINVYSKAETDLGQFLSNFAYAPIDHPVYGHFASIEGFWYWASTGQQYNQLRELFGYQAKVYGRTLQRVKCDDFQKMVKEMIRLKIESHPKYRQRFIDSTLPFTHYYYYGHIHDPKIIERDQDQWIVDYLEMLRASYKSSRIIIAGSRTIEDYNEVVNAVQRSGFIIKEVVSGLANGVDLLGKEYGEKNDIPVKEFPADWDTHGKKAGYIRNVEMAKASDGLIAIWDRKSKGTKNMIDIMMRMNKPVFVHIPKKHPVWKKS